MALKTRDERSNDVILSLEQEGSDVNINAEINGNEILIAFFDSNGRLTICVNNDKEVNLLAGNLAFNENNQLAVNV